MTYLSKSLSASTVPESIQNFMEPLLLLRKASVKYPNSDQQSFTQVSPQPTGRGKYVHDTFQVHFFDQGKLVRLGMVTDSKLGAIMWLAAFLDPSLRDMDHMEKWLAAIVHDEDFVLKWCLSVGHIVSKVPPSRGGGRPRVRV